MKACSMALCSGTVVEQAVQPIVLTPCGVQKRLCKLHFGPHGQLGTVKGSIE